MWRSKKFILVTILAGVVLVGSIGGVVLAQENGDGDQPKTTLLGKVCEIYNANTDPDIDCEALKDAFAQAQSEMRTEALKIWLQSLVEEGKITQGQADEYLEWWQAKPDVPLGFGFRGHGEFRGMGGMRGFGGLCLPAQ